MLAVMGSALDQLRFTDVSGTDESHLLKLYTLSTCGFCRRAMEFLERHNLHYRYIHLDQIDLELKRAAKKELKAKYDNLPVFPILTIDDSRAISGFVEEKWARSLEIEQ